MSNQKQVICFGELLWDCFPKGELLGGAPFNVGYRLHSLGVSVQLLSAVGRDQRGIKAMEQIKAAGLSLDGVAQHEEYSTGTVKVTLDASGSASYSITNQVAWDKIPVALNASLDNSILVFGSLALREQFNRDKLQFLLKACDVSVFDINLRPPNFDWELLKQLILACDMLKLNEEELPLVLKNLKINEESLQDQLITLSHKTNTPHICVTLGAQGAVLWSEEQYFVHPGYTVEVKDTVGAGDSFLAVLINELFLSKTQPQKALALACAMGALVASKMGATSKVSPAQVKAMTGI